MDEKLVKTDILQTLGKNIKQIRLLKGLSQENLASSLDKFVNFISLIENGKTGLSVQTIVDICDALDVDVNSIFAGIVKPTDAKADSFITDSLKLFDENDRAIVKEIITYIINSKN